MYADSGPDPLPDDQVCLVVEVFRMLADATRVQVLWSLADREMSVNELAEQVGKPAPSVSQHLQSYEWRGWCAPAAMEPRSFTVWRTSTCASSSSTPFSTPSTPVPGFPATTVLPADCSRSLRHRLPRMSG
ncbi:LOW QUALITY PROTEIN: hypothetical transcriptional regulatory protein, partial [Mycobacterium tuberculosis 02_1987]